VRLLEFTIFAGIVWAGYAGHSGWLVPLGASLVTLAGWWRKMRLLRQHPQVPLSTKMRTYLVISIAINLAFAAASLLAGRLLSYLLRG
jgi:hypothetical protein